MVDLIARVYIDNIHKTQQLNPRKNIAKMSIVQEMNRPDKHILLQNRIYGCSIKHLFVKYLLRVYLDITPCTRNHYYIFLDNTNMKCLN